MIVLTGDFHRDFERLFDFVEEQVTTKEDVIIILGDAGINYYLDQSDYALKQELNELPVTLFLVHGNHEERPEEINTYEERSWRGGTVYVEPEFPSLLFAKDGEIYDLDGCRAVAIGGAYSVDKIYRLRGGVPWFPSEQPDEYIKRRVEANLEKAGWRVDCVLSHTTPMRYMPRHAFLPVNQELVDLSTEEWLDTIEKRLSYDRWYAGHFHVDCREGPIRIMMYDFLELL